MQLDKIEVQSNESKDQRFLGFTFQGERMIQGHQREFPVNAGPNEVAQILREMASDIEKIKE